MYPSNPSQHERNNHVYAPRDHDNHDGYTNGNHDSHSPSHDHDHYHADRNTYPSVFRVSILLGVVNLKYLRFRLRLSLSVRIRSHRGKRTRKRKFSLEFEFFSLISFAGSLIFFCFHIRLV